ncbi:ClpP/crotonase-like domain-containing protein [Cercophora scortea]|uniref:ClpP/crotonase-like domain-containing protein n=1 Tax=Cercophora scortea TaxID=314031 RepID=A0AAE0IWE7_9PEZI|nr:ClpP/crotonase-like domain-containing protein [Cercophora scortea]
MLNSFTRSMRPIASRLQPTTLPRVMSAARLYSTTAPSTPAAATANSYEYIIVTEPRPGVAQVTLNRPKALNALCTPLISELNTALTQLNASPTTHAIILTGSSKAFAAGADIKEMAPLTFSLAYTTSFIESWSHLTTSLKKPLIAAVSGHALGGGCELALMSDILYCTSTANFGQPEIKLGTIPGAGGVSASPAQSFSGEEAEKWGVAARSFPTYEALMEGALKTAEVIAGYSRVAVQAAKEVVNKSQDLGLRDGVEYERRVFHSLFGSRDQKIGMAAFAEKKKAEWSHE